MHKDVISLESFTKLVSYWTEVGRIALSDCGHPPCATIALIDTVTKEFPDSDEILIDGLATMTMAFLLIGNAANNSNGMPESERQGYL